jgi:hypothetical protein
VLIWRAGGPYHPTAAILDPVYVMFAPIAGMPESYAMTGDRPE